MIELWHSILGTIKSAWISSQRYSDHTYRQIVGVPQRRQSEITPTLFLGGQCSERGYQILRKRGITGIVSLRMRVRENLAELGVAHFLHLPTLDHHAPTLAQLQKGVKFIDQVIENGGKVYIHCAFGEGRGPTMATAYLMSQKLTLVAALGQVKAVRSFIRLSNVQLARLSEYEKLLRAV